MTLSRLVLGASALVFGGIGLGFILFPHVLAGAVGIELTNVTADNDFRAVYGGVPAGLGVFLVMALRRPGWEDAALWVVLLTLGALAASRVLSLLVAGMPGAIAFVLGAAEVTGAVLASIALRRRVGQTPG